MTQSYLQEFQPPPRLLLGPGPSTVHPRVLQAMTLPVLGHLDPLFFQVMDEVCEMLRQVFGTANYMTAPLSSTGTGAMEAACANILERGDPPSSAATATSETAWPTSHPVAAPTPSSWTAPGAGLRISTPCGTSCGSTPA